MERFDRSDDAWMRRALRLATRGLRSCDPNPVVGAVVVKNGQKISEGWHQRTGQAHAEAQALDRAGHQARGATLYVTLEPCTHQGRTPACSEHIIRAGVTRVVIADCDPNPVASGGIKALRQAGIQVDVGLCTAQQRRLNVGFIHRMKHHKPWVILKIAATLDGVLAPLPKRRLQLTGTLAQASVQRMRARCTAIITGIGTVKVDNPRLNVRLTGALRQPEIVVLTSSGDLPQDANVTQAESLLLACVRTPTSAHATLACQADPHGKVDLKDLLTQLAQRGHNRVLVEAGAELTQAFLNQDLVNECHIYYAPCFSDGNGLRMLSDLKQGAWHRWRLDSVHRLQDDVRLTLSKHDTPQ